MDQKYTFHTDPGHGWLQVTHAELARLGIAHLISDYSYTDGTHAYLEEDCDLGKFIEAKRQAAETVTWNVEYRNNSAIRNYAKYRPHPTPPEPTASSTAAPSQEGVATSGGTMQHHVLLYIPRTVLLAMTNFAAPKEDVRYHLQGVCLEVGTKESRLTATNGHVLACYRLTGDEVIDPDLTESMQVLLPIAAITSAVKKKAPPKRSGAVGTTNDDIELRIHPPGAGGKMLATFIDNGFEHRFELIDGKFPDYRRVIPDTVSGKLAQFDPELLRGVVAADREMGGKGPLTIAHNGQDTALIDMGNENLCVVIMPYRHECPISGAPAWVRTPTTPEKKSKKAA